MKQTLLILLSSLLLMLGGKELRVLVMTPTPQMHCEKCENKIKKNLRFEKGIVKIETSVEEQTVTVTYDGRKTTKENIQAAMKKIGYDTKVVSDSPKDKVKKRKNNESNNDNNQEIQRDEELNVNPNINANKRPNKERDVRDVIHNTMNGGGNVEQPTKTDNK